MSVNLFWPCVIGLGFHGNQICDSQEWGYTNINNNISAATQHKILIQIQNKGTTYIIFKPYDMPLPYALHKNFKNEVACLK